MAEAHLGTEHMVSPEDRRATALLGMWVFLSTEILLFGGIFMTVLVYRVVHPAAVEAAAEHMKIGIGAINTLILLVSSLFVSVAIEAAELGNRRLAALLLLATAGCGVLFLGFKGWEYYQEWDEHLMPFLTNRPFALPDRASALYLDIYYAGTGLHGLHLTIGICLMSWLAWRTARSLGPVDALPVEIGGLYWHLIDLVWILVYSSVYLANRPY